MLNALPSFAEKPILASIIEVEDENGNKTLDFNGHDRIITEDKLNSEEKRVEYIEQIVGVIPANNNIQLLADNENETKKYVWVDGLIFNEYTYAPDIIKKRGTVDVSVELNVKKFSYNVENDYLSIDEFTFFGVTLLGAHVKPGMKGSMLQQYSNNKNEAKTYDFDMSSVVNHMYSLLQRIDATNEEGGESNLKLSELLKKYNKTQEELTFSVEGLSDEELENVFELEFGKQDDTENQIVFELSHDDIRMALYTLLKNSVEEEDYYSVWIMEVFDKYFIYQDYDKNKYFKQMYTKDNDVVEFNGDAEEVFLEFLTQSEKDELDAMKNNYTALEEFKLNYDREQLRKQKENILSNTKFAIIQETDEFKQISENIDDYSVEELDFKLKEMFVDYVCEHPETITDMATKEKPKINFAHSSKSKKYGNLFD